MLIVPNDLGEDKCVEDNVCECTLDAIEFSINVYSPFLNLPTHSPECVKPHASHF